MLSTLPALGDKAWKIDVVDAKYVPVQIIFQEASQISQISMDMDYTRVTGGAVNGWYAEQFFHTEEETLAACELLAKSRQH